MIGRSALLIAVGLAVGLAGCQPKLPACDPFAAGQVVYLKGRSDVTDDDGVPMYLGQAILHTSCAGAGLCHSSLAEGALRVGVPYGDDFDLGPPCIDAACATDDAALAAFRNRLRSVRERSDRLYAHVHRGHMPPGSVGATIARRSGTAYRLDSAGSLGAPIPSIATDEGMHALGVWLSCGAAAIETAPRPDATHSPGATCAAPGAEAGSCVTRLVLPLVPPDPTWTAIYTRVLGPLCGESCHGDTSPRANGPSLLGLDAAYDVLLHEVTDEGEHYVTPGAPEESHLLRHLDGSPDHAIMPPALLTHTLPSEVVDAIAMWIAAGAPLD